MSESRRSAILVFAVLCLGCVLAIAGLIHWSKTRGGFAGTGALSPGSREALLPSRPPERIYFRNNALGPDYGKLAFIDYERLEQPQFVDRLTCEAVHVSAGAGLCLEAERGVVTTYSAKVFDTGGHEVRAEFALGGVPSRTRVSPDGRIGATTVFVTGHGYDSVDFSTQTLLIDMRTGKPIADLEAFTVLFDGQPTRREDFNFWGVTFTRDGAFFYATLSTEGKHYLVKGDIAARTAEIVYANVECPSLSPDGTRVAYKKRYLEGSRIRWRLQVLDLDTLTETSLAEQRSIDDQIEWLDEDHVLYSVANGESSASTDVWVARADGAGTPSLFLEHAYSPAVVR